MTREERNSYEREHPSDHLVYTRIEDMNPEDLETLLAKPTETDFPNRFLQTEFS